MENTIECRIQRTYLWNSFQCLLVINYRSLPYWDFLLRKERKGKIERLALFLRICEILIGTKKKTSTKTGEQNRVNFRRRRKASPLLFKKVCDPVNSTFVQNCPCSGPQYTDREVIYVSSSTFIHSWFVFLKHLIHSWLKLNLATTFSNIFS